MKVQITIEQDDDSPSPGLMRIEATRLTKKQLLIVAMLIRDALQQLTEKNRRFDPTLN